MCMWFVHELSVVRPVLHCHAVMFMSEVVSLTCHLSISPALGVPSLLFEDASRSPLARSMLLKLSTQKSYQPGVSASDNCCVARGYSWLAAWNYANWKLPTVGCYCCWVKSVHFLKSSEPDALSCPRELRFLKSWRPLGRAELLQFVTQRRLVGFGCSLHPI